MLTRVAVSVVFVSVLAFGSFAQQTSAPPKTPSAGTGPSVEQSTSPSQQSPTPSASNVRKETKDSTTSDDVDYGKWILAFVTGAIGFATAYFVRKWLDKDVLAIQNFQYYYSDDVLTARAVAWNYLVGPYRKSLKPLSAWYKESNSEEEEKRYTSISRILNFWHLISILKKNKLINENLTKSLLRQHCLEWCAALTPLLAESKKAGDKLDAENLVADMLWIGITQKEVDDLAEDLGKRVGGAEAKKDGG